MMDWLTAWRYEMRASFAATRPTSFVVLAGVCDEGPSVREIAVRWVNEACQRWYEEQSQ